MKYPMKLTQRYDDYDDTITSQTIEWDYNNFKGEFFLFRIYGTAQKTPVLGEIYLMQPTFQRLYVLVWTSREKDMTTLM